MLSQADSPALNKFAGLLPELPGCGLVVAGISDKQAQLFTEECRDIQRWAEQRLHAYSSGRYCAHKVQALLGLPVRPITRQARMPVWPTHSVGSISHSKEIATAFASTAHRSVGVDLENAWRVTPSLYNKVFTTREIKHLEHMPTVAPSVLFSAKEAGYKAIYPLGREYIGFMQAEIKLVTNGETQGSFSIEYLGDHAPNNLLNSGFGYWCVHNEHIMTLFLIP